MDNNDSIGRSTFKNDRTIIITGGSRGIGAATARLASVNGFNVVVNYLNNRNLADSVVSGILENGGRAVAIQADVSNECEVVAMFDEAESIFGKIDSLVNNAGILRTQMRFEGMDVERLEKIFTINILGQLICAREAVKRMSVRNGGRGGTIVNVSSLAALTGSPNEYVDYATSKGAIDTFTIGLSKEVAGDGIRVNGVRPAFIATDIHADGGEPERIDRIKDSIPMRRGGTPEEVAEAIIWLASEKSSYSTGTFINITGGR